MGAPGPADTPPPGGEQPLGRLWGERGGWLFKTYVYIYMGFFKKIQIFFSVSAKVEEPNAEHMGSAPGVETLLP